MNFTLEDAKNLSKNIPNLDNAKLEILKLKNNVITILQKLYPSGIKNLGGAIDFALTKLVTDEKARKIAPFSSPEYKKLSDLKGSIKNDFSDKEDFISFFFNIEDEDFDISESISKINEITAFLKGYPVLDNINFDNKNFITAVIGVNGPENFFSQNTSEEDVNQMFSVFSKIDEPDDDQPEVVEESDIPYSDLGGANVSLSPENDNIFEEIETSAKNIADIAMQESFSKKLFNYKSLIKDAPDDEAPEQEVAAGEKTKVLPGTPRSIRSTKFGDDFQTFSYNANMSNKFYDRLTDNILKQLEIKNSMLDDLSKIDITSYYLPFAVVQNQDKILQLIDEGDSFRLVSDVSIFSQLVSSVLSVLAIINNKYNIHIVKMKSLNYQRLEAERYNCAMTLDDLALAIKERDRLVINKVNSIKEELRSNGINISNVDQAVNSILFSSLISRSDSKIAELFLDLAIKICFPKIMHQETMNKAAKVALGPSFENNEAEVDVLVEKASQSAKYYISNSIRRFFVPSDTNESISKYINQNFNMNLLMSGTASSMKGAVIKSWKYISCPTCKKLVYHSEQYSKKIPEIEKDISKAEEELYLPVLESDGSAITTSMLELNNDGTPRIFVDPLNPSKSYSWGEIKSMVRSDIEAQHLDGLRIRSAALKSLGAKKSQVKKPLISLRTKCPFPSSERPETKTELEVKDFTCGMSIDFDQLKNISSYSEIKNINIAPSDGTNQQQKLLSTLDKLISSGKISDSDKERFVKDLKDKMTGGWKNSNTVFSCPCKFSYENKNSKIESYNYIAFPMTGYVNSDLVEEFRYSPPTDEDGYHHDIEEGTASYVVCGLPTSLSSFVRDPADPGSLQNVLRVLKEDDIQNIYEIINILIGSGVDFFDVHTYLEELIEYSVEKSVKKISNIDKSLMEEIKKLATLNMARPFKGSSKGLNPMDLIGGLKLICSNGHKFAIEDSINFGISHHATNIKGYQKADAIIKSSEIVTSSGFDNFYKTMNMKFPNQIANFIEEIPRIQLSMRKDLSTWDGDYNKLNEYYFSYNGKYYIFNYVNKPYKGKTSAAWGSPIRSKLTNELSLISSDIDQFKDTATSKVIDMKMKVLQRDTPSPDGSASSLLDKLVDTGLNPEEAAALSKGEGDSRDVKYIASILSNHAKIAIMLSGSLSIVRDFSEVATRLEVYATLKPDPAFFESEKFTSGRNNYLSNVKLAAKTLYKYCEINSNSDASLEPSIMEVFERSFNENFFDYMKMQDIRLHDILGNAISIFSKDNLAVNIAESLLFAIKEVAGLNRASNIKNNVLKYVSYKVFGKGQNSDFIKVLKDSGAVQYIDAAYDEFLTAVNTLRATDKKELKGIVGEEHQPLKISNLKASEYLARVATMSSAVFLSEGISSLWRKYFIPKSNNYIGYTFAAGVDLSSPSDILSDLPDDSGLFRAEAALSKISIDLSQNYIDMMDGNYEDISESLSNATELMASDMAQIINGIKVSSSSKYYMDIALKLIRETLLKKVSASEFSDNTVKQNTLNLIKNCLIAPPITSIDLSQEGKYNKYFSDVDNFRKLPIFAASVLGSVEDGSFAYNISKSLNNFDIAVTTSPGTIALLSRLTSDEIANLIQVKYNKKIVPNDITSFINSKQDLVKLGWKLYEVPAIKLNPSQTDIQISYFYHPYTYGIDKTESWGIPSESSQHFVNNPANLDTRSGFSIGPFTNIGTSNKFYPPMADYSTSYDRPGLIFPMDYSVEIRRGKAFDTGYRQDHNPIYPIFDPRVPVKINLPLGESVHIDVSDFLVREPADMAMGYLNQIFKLHKEFKTKEFEISARGRRSGDQFKLKERKVYTESIVDLKIRYKKEISILYSRYRDLPLFVAATKVSSAPRGIIGKPQIPVDIANSGYIPMWDYVTINKIISSEAFSPEFGGHDMWDSQNPAEKANVISAVRSMIIEMNDLERLAGSINKLSASFSYKDGRINISPGMLDLTNTRYSITADDLISPSYDPLDASIGYSVKIKAAVLAIYGKLLDKNVISTHVIKNEDGTVTPIEDVIVDRFSKHLIGKPITSSDELFHMRGDEGMTSHTINTFKEGHRDWMNSSGKFYNISSDISREDLGEYPARFKIITDIFPFDKGDSTRLTDITNIQDPNNDTILRQHQIYASSTLKGRPLSTELIESKRAPLPSDPEEAKKRISEREKKLKNVIATGSVNLLSSASNAAASYFASWISGYIEDKAMSAGVEGLKTTKKAISLADSNFYKKASKPSVVAEYKLLNISLAAIASLVSEISKPR